MAEADDLQRVKRMLKAFFDARHTSVTADGLRLWLDAFSDLSVDAIETALRRFNRDSTDYPTPAAVRRFAGSQGMTDEERAHAAWRSVRSAILKYGAYYTVEFDDPIVHAAVHAMGGWVSLCRTPHHEMSWQARTFVTQYTSVARSGTGDFRRLAGLLSCPAAVEITTGLLPHANCRAVIQDQRQHEGRRLE